MSRRNPVILFLCVFVPLYVALVFPWTGWGRIYGVGFQKVGSVLFGGVSGLREVSFESLEDERHPSATRIVIVNRNMIHGNSVPVWNLDIDALAIGWKPAALLIALVLATPVSWRRRGWALLWGVLCVHAVILLFLAFSIWNQSTEVSLVTLSPFQKRLADGFRDFLIWQYALVMPAVIWVLVTFRKEDRVGPLGVSLFGPVKDGAGEADAKIQKQPRK